MSDLMRHSRAAGAESELNDELRDSLAWLIGFLPQAAPREVRVGATKKPVVVFTDGPAEDEVTAGGVIFIEGRPPEFFFGERVPQELVSRWMSQGGK